MKTLSIVIPVYNEKNTIFTMLDCIEKNKLPGISYEIIIIDDASTDGTREKIESLAGKPRYRLFFHDKNKGKGAAIRLGFANATGDFIIIQDADLEYSPAEYGSMITPLVSGEADVVYGSRFVGDKPHRVLFFWHYLANKFLTSLSNIFTNLNLTDMETCYKAFTMKALRSFASELKSNRFGIEPEITALVAKKKLRIYEVGISYSGRTYEEGKKINWKDGFSALWSIIKFNLFS